MLVRDGYTRIIWATEGANVPLIAMLRWMGTKVCC
jgi:hypothetical protein